MAIGTVPVPMPVPIPGFGSLLGWGRGMGRGTGKGIRDAPVYLDMTSAAAILATMEE